MPGLTRTPLPSLRPAADAATPPLPRRVMRHLIVAAELKVGSRVVVGGDESGRVATLLRRLGIEAETAGVSRLADGEFDAAVWLEVTPAAIGERSLVSAAALGRTGRLLAAIRPGGFFVIAARVDEAASGHQPECLERHLSTFPGPVEATFLRDWSPGGWFRATRAGYAVATWQAPAGVVGAGLWRRRATAAGSGSCCDWAAVASARKAA